MQLCGPTATRHVLPMLLTISTPACRATLYPCLFLSVSRSVQIGDGASDSTAGCSLLFYIEDGAQRKRQRGSETASEHRHRPSERREDSIA